MLSGSLSAENLIIFDVGEHAGVACGLGGLEVFGNGLGVTDVVDVGAEIVDKSLVDERLGELAYLFSVISGQAQHINLERDGGMQLYAGR